MLYSGERIEVISNVRGYVVDSIAWKGENAGQAQRPRALDASVDGGFRDGGGTPQHGRVFFSRDLHHHCAVRRGKGDRLAYQARYSVVAIRIHRHSRSEGIRIRVPGVGSSFDSGHRVLARIHLGSIDFLADEEVAVVPKHGDELRLAPQVAVDPSAENRIGRFGETGELGRPFRRRHSQGIAFHSQSQILLIRRMRQARLAIGIDNGHCP